LKLKNTTDIPIERIREIIKFVKPRGLLTPRYVIRITNSRRGHVGKFYSSGHIIARIKKDEKGYPYYTDYTPQKRRPYRKITFYYDKLDQQSGQYSEWYVTRYYQNIRDQEKVISSGGYINHFILSREEELIHVLSHEFRHFWQKNHPGRRGRVWGARGQFSDKDADAYAIRKTREWRQLHNQSQAVNWNLVEEQRWKGELQEGSIR
jgi:hypothetical protein